MVEEVFEAGEVRPVAEGEVFVDAEEHGVEEVPVEVQVHQEDVEGEVPDLTVKD